MELFLSVPFAQTLTLLVLTLLTIQSPTVNGKALIATGNDLGSDVSETSEPSEDVATEKDVQTTTTINTALNEVNTSDDEIPIFNRNQVTLDLPGDLFSTTANLTLRLRSFIGDFITRTSVRIAQVVRFFQPLFGYHLMIDIPKELDV